MKEELGGAFRQAFGLLPPCPSRTQADVAKQLRKSLPELEFEQEFVDPTSGYSIDIWAERSGAGSVLGKGSREGKGWAVEVDGPTHFLQSGSGSGQQPRGNTLLKRRQLEQLGYTAVSVPYWEWNAFQGKSREQLRRYFRGKLRIDQGPAPPSSLSGGKGGPEGSGGTEDDKGGDGQLERPPSRLKGLTKSVGRGCTMGGCP